MRDERPAELSSLQCVENLRLVAPSGLGTSPDDERSACATSLALPLDVDRCTLLLGSLQLLAEGTAVADAPPGTWLKDVLHACRTCGLSSLPFLVASLEADASSRSAVTSRALHFGLEPAAISLETERRQRVLQRVADAAQRAEGLEGVDCSSRSSDDSPASSSVFTAKILKPGKAAAAAMAFEHASPASHLEMATFDTFLSMLRGVAASSVSGPNEVTATKYEQQEGRAALGRVPRGNRTEAASHAHRLLSVIRMLHNASPPSFHVSRSWTEGGERAESFDDFRDAHGGAKFFSIHEETFAMLLFRGLSRSAHRSKALAVRNFSVTLAQGAPRVVQADVTDAGISADEQLLRNATKSLTRRTRLLNVIIFFTLLAGAVLISVMNFVTTSESISQAFGRLHGRSASVVGTRLVAAVNQMHAPVRYLADRLGEGSLPANWTATSSPAAFDADFITLMQDMQRRGNLCSAIYTITPDGGLHGARVSEAGIITLLAKDSTTGGALREYATLSTGRTGAATFSESIDVRASAWFAALAGSSRLGIGWGPGLGSASSSPVLRLLRVAHTHTSGRVPSSPAQVVGWSVCEVTVGTSKQVVDNGDLLGSRAMENTHAIGLDGANTTATKSAVLVIDATSGNAILSSGSAAPRVQGDQVLLPSASAHGDAAAAAIAAASAEPGGMAMRSDPTVSSSSSKNIFYVSVPVPELQRNIGVRWVVVAAAPHSEYAGVNSFAVTVTAVFGVLGMLTLAAASGYSHVKATRYYFEVHRVKMARLKSQWASQLAAAKQTEDMSRSEDGPAVEQGSRLEGTREGLPSEDDRVASLRRPSATWLPPFSVVVIGAVFMIQYFVWVSASESVVDRISTTVTYFASQQTILTSQSALLAIGYMTTLTSRDLDAGRIAFFNSTTGRFASSPRTYMQLYNRWQAGSGIGDWGASYVYGGNEAKFSFGITCPGSMCSELANGTSQGSWIADGHSQRSDGVAFAVRYRLPRPEHGIFETSPLSSAVFDPTTRPWYQQAPLTNMPLALEPFRYDAQFGNEFSLGIVQSTNSTTGDPKRTVLASELSTAPLSRMLRAARLTPSTSGAGYFLVNNIHGAMVASSDPAAVPVASTCSNLPLGNGTSNAFLTRLNNGLKQTLRNDAVTTQYSPEVVLETGLGADAAWTSLATTQVFGKTFVFITSMWKPYFKSTLVEWQRIGFIVVATIIALSLVVIGSFAATTASMIADVATDMEQALGEAGDDDEEELLGVKIPSSAVLERRVQAVLPYVLRVLHSLQLPVSERRKTRVSLAEALKSSQERAESGTTDIEDARRAKYAVQAAARGMEVLHALDLEASGSMQALWLYRLFVRPWYTTTVLSISATLMLLSFWEGAGSREAVDAFLPWVLSVEMVCLLLLAGDIYVDTVANGFRKHRYDSVSPTSEVGESARITGLRATLLARYVIVAAMLIDWVVRVATGYRLGFDNDFAIPATAALRPLILVTRSPTTRRSLSNFMSTLVHARETLILIFSFLSLVAMLAMVVLQDVVPSNGALASGFSSFHSSFITLFIYLFSADNYADVISPAANSANGGSPVYKLVFAAITVIGTFLIASILIANFQATYTSKQEATATADTVRRRVGFVTAFAMLDQDGNGYLDPQEFRPFFVMCATGINAGVFGFTTITVQDFVLICEELAPLIDRVPEASSKGSLIRGVSGRGLRRTQVVAPRNALHRAFMLMHTRYYQTTKSVVLLIITLHIIACTMFRTRLGDVIGVVLLGIFFCYWVDLVTRIIGLGIRDFWMSSRHLFEAQVNRFDLVIMSLSSLFAVGDFIYRQASGTGVSSFTRFVLALPVLRIFGVLPEFRRVVFGLASVIPVLSSLFGVLISMLYWFAIVGCLSFESVLSSLPVSVYADRDTATFDSFDAAVGLIVQMSVGAITAPLVAVVNATNSYAPAFYFIVFTLAVLLFFSNAVVGVVIDSYSEFESNAINVHVESEPVARFRKAVGQPPMTFDADSRHSGST